MNNLSEAEKVMTAIIRKFECITLSQARYIMKKYLQCSSAQTNIILSELSAREHLTIRNEKYVIVGGKRTSTKIKLNRGLIECIYYAIDHIDTLDELQMMYIPLNGATLSYIAGGQMYQLLYLTSDTLVKAAILQNQYTDSIKKLNKHIPKEDFSFTTGLIFGPSESEDDILDKLESLNLNMPHEIVFVKTKDITEKPQYHIYQTEE